MCENFVHKSQILQERQRIIPKKYLTKKQKALTNVIY